MNNDSLKNKLMVLNVFEDNNYFEAYLRLIRDNIMQKKVLGATQRHHIIPKNYYKMMSLKPDNSKSNIINLYYKDHIKAHCYLSLCSVPETLKLSNNFTIYKMLGARYIDDEQLKNIDFELIQQVYEQNKLLQQQRQPMHCPGIIEKHGQKMRTAETRHKISESMQQVRRKSKDHVYIHKDKEEKRIPPEQLENYISEGWIIGPRTGRVRIHKQNKETTIWPEDLPKYIQADWELGGVPGRMTAAHKEALARSHKDHFKDPKVRKKQSERLKAFYAANPSWQTRSKHPIKIYNDENTYIFDTVKEAEKFIGLRETCQGQGLLRKSFKAGIIKIKYSKYYGWHIIKLPQEGGDVNEWSAC